MQGLLLRLLLPRLLLIKMHVMGWPNSISRDVIVNLEKMEYWTLVLLLSLFYTVTANDKPAETGKDQKELENRVKELEGAGFLLC